MNYWMDMKREDMDKLQKTENTAMRRILKAPKWAAQTFKQADIKELRKETLRNKQQQVKNIKEQAVLFEKDKKKTMTM